ncbi:alpha/beta fold hydrolase [Streptomyces tsukubensis]|uniref:Alpha/beta hydrolase n=1 Tax=Streptomyces tsukubensis TaxID=83656 RepID=A0A1V4ABR0_9ACTN|nr:alpha/beta hydrolase [Streptomyces tsukubensis]OON81094.1 alpha/beta hydrolase [Streptomyces tsukubensis]QFR94930.1 alpha/beta fold hydrolase [Streptomyces tsukubensis]
MKVVFVNGNPENAAVWDLLCDELRGIDAVRLSLPGFGAPVPEGFGCAVADYRDWLIGRLEAIGEPVHLVGHDVGGSTVVSVAMKRPESLLSWVSDSLGVFHPDYVWHDLAQQWQTPGVGEESVAGLMGGSLEERAARMTARGIPEAVARRMAPAQGPEMGRAILAFYRSAAQPVMAELGRDLADAARRPGLAIIGTDDRFVGSEEMRRESAARAGAEPAVLRDIGHWWMVQDPARSARALTSFWAGRGQADSRGRAGSG